MANIFFFPFFSYRPWKSKRRTSHHPFLPTKRKYGDSERVGLKHWPRLAIFSSRSPRFDAYGYIVTCVTMWGCFRAQLINYLLDFGYVVLGTVRSHVVRVTNSGHVPVSFAPDRSALHGTGFVVELDRIRNLPGAPDHESVEFVVTFDPKSTSIPLGPVDVHVPITVLGGPSFGLRIKATVAMPDMSLSTDLLEFGTVECGQCKVMTIQLHNHQQVRYYIVLLLVTRTGFLKARLG